MGVQRDPLELAEEQEAPAEGGGLIGRIRQVTIVEVAIDHRAVVLSGGDQDPTAIAIQEVVWVFRMQAEGVVGHCITPTSLVGQRLGLHRIARGDGLSDTLPTDVVEQPGSPSIHLMLSVAALIPFSR